MPEILKWAEIKENFQGGALLLGNGASMSIHSEFGYASLRTAAQEAGNITPVVSEVFTAFGTDDFELVLRRLWQAKLVNQALHLEPGKVEEAYQQVREALIATVRDVHIAYDEATPYLDGMYKFMQGFKTVLSLNYDLLVYWAMMLGNKSLGRWFKDGFQQGGVFRDDWQVLREPLGAKGSTLVFYPHGNLIAARTANNNEQKLAAAGGENIGLLDRILEQWSEGECVPLFVCEGTAEQKKRAIASSPYLSRQYWEVLPSVSPALVVYGWNCAEQDRHLLDQIKMLGHTSSVLPFRFSVKIKQTLSGFKMNSRHWVSRCRFSLTQKVQVAGFILTN